MARMLTSVALLVASADAFNVMPRREALRIGVAAALPTLLAEPAFAKSKRSEIFSTSEAKEKIAETTGLAAGSAGKGLRGTASAAFDSNDTVVKNRKQNGGLALDKNGKKIVISDRNPDPASLGLKQWSGN